MLNVYCGMTADSKKGEGVGKAFDERKWKAKIGRRRKVQYVVVPPLRAPFFFFFFIALFFLFPCIQMISLLITIVFLFLLSLLFRHANRLGKGKLEERRTGRK